jgi:hypothetical protein
VSLLTQPESCGSRVACVLCVSRIERWWEWCTEYPAVVIAPAVENMSRKLSLCHNELIGLLARTIASYDPALWGGRPSWMG